MDRYSPLEVDELSEKEVRSALEQIIDFLGCELVAYKLDGERRTVELRKTRPQRT